MTTSKHKGGDEYLIILQKEIAELKAEVDRLKRFTMDRSEEEIRALKVAIDRAEFSEHENIRLSSLMEGRSRIMHPLYGACDCLENGTCSVCQMTKRVADTSEKYAQENTALRKVLLRSEVLMMKAAFNRKMREPEAIRKVSDAAETLSVEIKKLIE